MKNDGSKAYVGSDVGCENKDPHYGGERLAEGPRAPGADRRIGMDVYFTPPQACKQDGTLDYYAAKITQVNERSKEFGNVETVELITFGPNSFYFQHNVPFSHHLKPGHWSWR